MYNLLSKSMYANLSAKNLRELLIFQAKATALVKTHLNISYLSISEVAENLWNALNWRDLGRLAQKILLRIVITILNTRTDFEYKSINTERIIEVSISLGFRRNKHRLLDRFSTFEDKFIVMILYWGLHWHDMIDSASNVSWNEQEQGSIGHFRWLYCYAEESCSFQTKIIFYWVNDQYQVFELILLGFINE